MRSFLFARGYIIPVCIVLVWLCCRHAAAMDPESARKAEFFRFPPGIEERLLDAGYEERREIVLRVLRLVGMSEAERVSTRIRLLCEIDRFALQEGISFLEYSLSWGRHGFWFREQALAARVYLRLKTERMVPKKRIEFLVGTLIPGYPYEVQQEALKVLDTMGAGARRRLYDTICDTDTDKFSSFEQIRPLLAARGVARLKALAPNEAELSRMTASSSPVANVLAVVVLEERIARLVTESRFEEAAKTKSVRDALALSLFESPGVARLGLRGIVDASLPIESFPRLFKSLAVDGYDDNDIEVAVSLLRRLCRVARQSPKRVSEATVKDIVPSLKDMASLAISVPEEGSAENCRLLWLRMRARELALEVLGLSRMGGVEEQPLIKPAP